MNLLLLVQIDSNIIKPTITGIIINKYEAEKFMEINSNFDQSLHLYKWRVSDVFIFLFKKDNPSEMLALILKYQYSWNSLI